MSAAGWKGETYSARASPEFSVLSWTPRIFYAKGLLTPGTLEMQCNADLRQMVLHSLLLSGASVQTPAQDFLRSSIACRRGGGRHAGACAAQDSTQRSRGANAAL